MAELPFAVQLEWAGSGGEGAGRIVTDDLELEYSVPASMGGRGVGSNPEELLVCAVGACYSATLNGVLRRAGLPASGVRVAATATVSGYPEHARFAQLTVSPTIIGGDASRSVEYDHAARAAHDRCFIGRTIAGAVDYRLGTVTVAPALVAA
ncbi:MAG TPA: OsmC family protein [Gaiellaceae bacterium]|nr:OsmC family protein [Gaiellaceae bacterium]